MHSNNSTSCNLRFLQQDFTISIVNNIAELSVGYFIENQSNMTISNIFNTGKISFSKELVFDNISTNNDNLNIEYSQGEINYIGNIGSLSPGETTLITLNFNVISSSRTGNFIISNISNINDGANDNITFAKDLTLNIVKTKTSLTYSNNIFNYEIINNNNIRLRAQFSSIIELPQNIEVIFKNFGLFSATYLNTKDVVPTNQIVSNGNIVNLETKTIILNPLSSVTISVIFDLVSSNQVGQQVISSTIKKLSIRGPVINLPTKNTCSDTAYATVILDLL